MMKKKSKKRFKETAKPQKIRGMPVFREISPPPPPILGDLCV